MTVGSPFLPSSHVLRDIIGELNRLDTAEERIFEDINRQVSCWLSRMNRCPMAVENYEDRSGISTDIYWYIRVSKPVGVIQMGNVWSQHSKRPGGSDREVGEAEAT